MLEDKVGVLLNEADLLVLSVHHSLAAASVQVVLPKNVVVFELLVK